MQHAPVRQAENKNAKMNDHDCSVPQYAGLDWVGGALPTRSEAWLKSKKVLRVQPGFYLDEATQEEVEAYAQQKLWVWPSRTVYLLSDVHADADAFRRSLVASGGVRITGAGDQDFELTAEGSEATFIIAGDCFDKGPSNLRLLRAVRHLMTLSNRVKLLAGNHDVRALVGMCCAGQKSPRLAHLFVRMGKKAVPLIKELCDHYVQDKTLGRDANEERRLHDLLFPGDEWFAQFPEVAGEHISAEKLARELERIREKTAEFKARCVDSGLSLAHVFAAIEQFKSLFLDPSGEFSWFFSEMTLCHRIGSLLYLHAGVDDVMARRIQEQGVEGANAWFRELLAEENFFDLYHGPVGNAFRTKYRSTDHPLTPHGVERLHSVGIYGVIHGHRSINHGQRIIFRAGMLNIECDATVDINSRELVGLEGPGGAATVFRPNGQVLGISTDYSAVKVFEPTTVAELVTLT